MLQWSFIFSLLSVISWARPEINFLTEAEVSPRDNIYLIDLVKLKNHDENLLQLLNKISIKQLSGHENSDIYFNAEELLKIIRSDEKIKKWDAKIFIPDQIKIRVASTLISKQEVERKIENSLSINCSDCEYEVNLTHIPKPSDVHWTLKLDGISEKGSVLIPIVENNLVTTKWIAGIINIKRKTWVTTRFLKYGERIQNEDLKKEKADITYLKDSLAIEKNIVGSIVNRAIRPGQPILTSDLRREPAVMRGQIITAITGSTGYEISNQLLAEENGFIGDMIKIKHMDQKKYLTGTVENNGLVRIK